MQRRVHIYCHTNEQYGTEITAIEQIKEIHADRCGCKYQKYARAARAARIKKPSESKPVDYTLDMDGNMHEKFSRFPAESTYREKYQSDRSYYGTEKRQKSYSIDTVQKVINAQINTVRNK